mgnify:CR=1 FL=1
MKIIENRIVTTASADIPLKGLRYLIDALPKVLEDFPKTHLIVIGKSPNESKIRKLIEDLDLNEKVIFKQVVHGFLFRVVNPIKYKKTNYTNQAYQQVS